MLRRLYDWCVAAAGRPYAAWLMGAISFAGKLVLSDPARHHADPDVAGAAGSRLVLRARLHRHVGRRRHARLLHRRAALRLGRALADPLYGYGDKVDAFRAAYAQWGAWIILLKGLTPIPYKIVTITSGFAGYNFWMFVGLSFIARGIRFYLLAFLLNRYGPQARAIIEERLGFWVTLAAVVLVVGIVAALYLF